MYVMLELNSSFQCHMIFNFILIYWFGAQTFLIIINGMDRKKLNLFWYIL